MHFFGWNVAVKLPETTKDSLSMVITSLQGQTPCTPISCLMRVVHGNLHRSVFDVLGAQPTTAQQVHYEEDDRATLIHRKGQRTLAR